MDTTEQLGWCTECGQLRRHTEHSGDELPHVRGQGQKLGGPHARGAVAKRSYPTSEVRGSSQECQAAMTQEWPKGATPCLRSGAAAERSYPLSDVGAVAESARWQQCRNGLEELPHARGQEWQLGGATPRPRPRVAAETSNPTSKEQWLCGRRRA